MVTCFVLGRLKKGFFKGTRCRILLYPLPYPALPPLCPPRAWRNPALPRASSQAAALLQSSREGQ